MPVTDQTTSNSSTGNGVTTVYPYTYKILDEADILVEVDGVAKTLTTHYTVSGVGVSGGGNVTFVTAPASGAVVVLSRSMAYSRDTDYQENGDLLAATLDEDVDRVTMLVQQVRQLIRRAVKLPSGVTADQVLGTGNTAAERASKLIGFDSDGDPALFTVADLDPSLVTAFIATLFDDADAETARTTLGLPDVSQAEAEAGTGTSVRAWTPERVAQAIAALETIVDLDAVAGVPIHGTNTNDDAATGYIGEYVESIGLAVAAGISGQYKDITSITLTAGDWDVSAIVLNNIAGATMIGASVMGIGTSTGNNAAGLVGGDTSMEFLRPDSSTNTGASIPAKRKSLSGTTTLYLKGYCTYSAGTPTFSGRISARRVR